MVFARSHPPSPRVPLKVSWVHDSFLETGHWSIKAQLDRKQWRHGERKREALSMDSKEKELWVSLPLKRSALICPWCCWASSPRLRAGLWIAAAQGVGWHRQSYICLSVITNQDEGYMGNYHWQLIPSAYRGIQNMSQWSTCLSETPWNVPVTWFMRVPQSCYWHNATQLIQAGLL